MPHIIVEHSSDVLKDVPAVLHGLHESLAAQDTVTMGAIKTRAIPITHAVVGDDAQSDLFVHIVLRLLPGRDEALRLKMAQDLQAVARTHVEPSVSVTTEVQELHAASYCK